VKRNAKVWLVAIVVAVLVGPFLTVGTGWATGALHWTGPSLFWVVAAWPVFWGAATVWAFRRMRTSRWYIAALSVGLCLAMVLGALLMLYAMIMVGALFM
jgi:hypothetical protein